MLTKSAYIKFLQCQKAAWLEVKGEIAKQPLSDFAQRTMREGQHVGQMARACFPGGLLITGDLMQATQATQRAMQNAGAIFEAAFAVFDGDGLQCRLDILARNGDLWDVYEVKASTGEGNSEAKKEKQKPTKDQIQDVAFQWHVLEQVGIPVGNVYLVLLNDKCRYPYDLRIADQDEPGNALFIRVLVNEDAAEWKSAVPTNIALYRDTLARVQPPPVNIGSHCRNPNDCRFIPECWKRLPKIGNVFKIPNLYYKKRDALIAQGILDARDLPADFRFTAPQQHYMDMLLSGKPKINKAEIRSLLSGLRWPLAFFDYETMNYAVPRYDGSFPYQQIPVQASLHVQVKRGGTVTHYEYLHDDEETDPRIQIAEWMIRHFPKDGHIIVYSQSFEKGRMRELGQQLPQYKAAMDSMIPRLWDLADFFKFNSNGEYAYLHPDQDGRWSIKYITNILAPEMSYAGMKVAKGDQAQAAYESMLAASGQKRKDWREALLAYCEKDTLVMKVILYRLMEIADGLG